MAYRIKPWEELTIQDDYMFKLAMRNKRICIQMIELTLGIRVRDIEYIEEEKSLKNGYASKGVRLDVYAVDGGNVFEVEMQVRRLEPGELPKRTRYYQSAIDMDCLMAGQKYKELPVLYIIFICPFEVFDGMRHIYTFRNLCVEDKSIELEDRTTKVFLSAKGKLNDIPSGLKAFLDYVDGTVSEDGFVQEIEEEIQRIKLLEKERVAYMTYVMKLAEEREEGISEGIALSIRNLMDSLGMDVEQAMDVLKVPMKDRPDLAARCESESSL